LTAILFLTLTPGSGVGQEPGTAGHWEGSIDLLGTPLTVLVDLSHENGIWSGAIDIPTQGYQGLPLTAIRIAGSTVEFTIAGRPGGTFRGTVEEGRISGTYSQGRVEFPFYLGRETVALPTRPQEPKPPFPYSEEEVTYTNGDITLAGSLTLPPGDGTFPAVLLINGSGPSNRNGGEGYEHKSFLVLADYLTRAGIAVLRLDKRGVGGSTGNLRGATIADLAGDALAGVGYLGRRSEIDSKRIGLLGHSEGGVIAPLVASRSDQVAFVILMAAPGVPWDEVMVLQNKLVSRVRGMSEDLIAVQDDAMRRQFDLLKLGADSTNADLRAQTRRLVEVRASALPGAGPPSSQDMEAAISGRIREFMMPPAQYNLHYDPRPTLQKLRVPVLVLNGELDLAVDWEQNLPEIEQALNEGGNPDYTIRHFPGLNHLFQKATTGDMNERDRIEETINPEVLQTIRDWILQRTAIGTGG